LFLFTDFDGTLVPLARTPGQARLAPAVRRLLAQLAKQGVLVGIASGRRLADVRARAGVRCLHYIGSHGFSYARPGGRPVILLEPKQRAAMAEVRRKLEGNLRGLPGIHCESKEGALAVHYRTASKRSAAAAEAAIREVRAARPSLHLLSGKKVWELLPERRTSKWTAMQRILRQEPRTGSRLLFYLGDDATDERVFERMTGISVAVGKRRRTAARFYLRSPREVRLFLERLRRVLQ
ncbi:MAG: trehalose-phosphatase, partial [Terriglobia bacterium]